MIKIIINNYFSHKDYLFNGHPDNLGPFPVTPLKSLWCYRAQSAFFCILHHFITICSIFTCNTFFWIQISICSKNILPKPMCVPKYGHIGLIKTNVILNCKR